MEQARQDQISGISQAYATADFDFAGYLLTLHSTDGSQQFQIADLLPFPRIERGGPSRGYERFRFLITQKDGDDEVADLVAHIKKIHGQYVNGEVLVEPTDYMNKRRQLRTLLENKRTASNER